MSNQSEVSRIATAEAPPLAPSRSATDCAIVVGISWYPYLGDLGGPLNDAKEFNAWLLDKSGGCVPENRVKLIQSPDSHGSPENVHPIQQELQQAFDWIDDLAANNLQNGLGRRVGRRLYLFFAGHGFAPQDNQTALLMANATQLRVGYHILGPAYADWFYHAGYFDEILLFMDCCRELCPRAPLNPPHFGSILDNRAAESVRRFYGYGTRWSKVSRERPMPPDNIVRGVFSTALLAGLRGAAADESGKVTSSSLYNYLFENMRTFLAPADMDAPTIPKEPDIFVFPKIDSDWVIVEGLAQPVATVRITSSEPNLTAQLRDGKFQLMASRQAAPQEWLFEVPPGIYEARIVADGGTRICGERTITLKAGGQFHVDF